VNEPVRSVISCSQMVANATFGRAFVGIVAVVQDVLLDVAEDRLGWVIVRTPFGHARPMQPQLPHRPPRHPRLDGMRRIAIQADPHHRRGYHRRTRRRKRQTYFALLPG